MNKENSSIFVHDAQAEAAGAQTGHKGLDNTDGMRAEFANTNSKDIWKNALLCAQFFRGYSNVSLLKDVQPEDIEDITESLRPFVGVEYEGDAVKRIHLHDMGDREVYVVGLLEHKSGVDYDVTFQLLKYMVGIWALYRNRAAKRKAVERTEMPGEMPSGVATSKAAVSGREAFQAAVSEKGNGIGESGVTGEDGTVEENGAEEKKFSSENKDFSYPLIIPIVYYEGKGAWTASRHWKDRVEFSEEFGQYVPDFTYEVVELNRYSAADLLSGEEELSLVMALNRMQSEQDLNFASWPEEQRRIIDKILRKAPQDVIRILAQMIHHFGLKMNVPDEDLLQYIRYVEDRSMGELWANMDKIDIQEIKRNAAAEGQETQLISMICKKLRKGKIPAEIAEELEEPLDKIIDICAIAKNFAPEYDAEKIYRALRD